MNIVLFGCKDTTYHVAKTFKDLPAKLYLVTISPEKGQSQDVAGYFDFSENCNLFEEMYVASRYDLKCSADEEFFTTKKFDIGIVVGWQRLIPNKVLSFFNIGVFGMHGSAQNLPFGRGRSPMNWSILEGRNWFYTNLFRYTSGVDDGPILDTECFSISTDDTAETLHYKNTLSLIRLVKKNWGSLSSNNLTLTEQVQSKGSFYPKRTPNDSVIDWSDSINNIEKLIRAVTLPFNGAFTTMFGREYKILRIGIFYTDLEIHPFRNKSDGTICDIFPNGKFLVRCNGGVILVHEFETLFNEIKVDYIFDKPVEKKVFPRNKYGNFDF
jgi:UDP-4-amino-4-deoxy-L-arabinose formyltransferase/UDP-glucuronic acid dehydrogenase (UDP-4-keto-hexauronic acid decarboxylating)